jgi:alpha,alpha-trehalase
MGGFIEQPAIKLSNRDLDAVIFDMDGVVTQTATLHAAAWKQLFDRFLQNRLTPGEALKPFTDEDYLRYVDGKPRYDGVISFLASRGVELPYGDPSDPPTEATVCGLGNGKDSYFRELVEKRGVEAFASTVDLIHGLKAAGLKTGIFSASRNAEAILSAAGVLNLFDARVDGNVARELGLPGKPDPATLLELTRRLGATSARTAVVEDAIAGVQAGRRGGFALVIGVNRSSTSGRLLDSGANVEVADLAEVRLEM